MDAAVGVGPHNATKPLVAGASDPFHEHPGVLAISDGDEDMGRQRRRPTLAITGDAQGEGAVARAGSCGHESGPPFAL